MIYIKRVIGDDVEMKTPVYEDEFFTTCPVCGKEYPLEPKEIADIINEGGDFSGTCIVCKDCVPKYRELTGVKE